MDAGPATQQTDQKRGEIAAAAIGSSFPDASTSLHRWFMWQAVQEWNKPMSYENLLSIAH